MNEWMEHPDLANLEISLILSAIKEGKSKQEQAQIDQMVQMIRTIQAGKQPPRSGRQ